MTTRVTPDRLHLSPTLAREPGTRQLQRLLGLDLPTTLGTLQLLYAWAVEFAPTGRLAGWAAADVEAAVEWTGAPGVCAQALVTAGVVTPDGRLVGWDVISGGLPARLLRADVRKARNRGVYNHDGVLEEVRRRDRDTCQFCRRTVDYADRRSPAGGTYAPRSAADPEDLVVACRACGETAAQADGKKSAVRATWPAPALPDPHGKTFAVAGPGATAEHLPGVNGKTSAVGATTPAYARVELTSRNGHAGQAGGSAGLALAAPPVGPGARPTTPAEMTLPALPGRPGEPRAQAGAPARTGPRVHEPAAPLHTTDLAPDRLAVLVSKFESRFRGGRHEVLDRLDHGLYYARRRTRPFHGPAELEAYLVDWLERDLGVLARAGVVRRPDARTTRRTDTPPPGARPDADIPVEIPVR